MPEAGFYDIYVIIVLIFNSPSKLESGSSGQTLIISEAYFPVTYPKAYRNGFTYDG